MPKTSKIKISKNKILLFGGIYSNLQALQGIRKIAETKGFQADQIICNGDIVGYCAQPEECVQLIKEWGIHCILGNVELQLREGEADCGCDFEVGTNCDTFSRKWYPFAQKQMSQESINWMKTLTDFIEFQFANKKATVVHGSKSKVSQFIFKSTPWEIKEQQFQLADSDIIIGGHCGLPFKEEKEGKLWINPGVIGMPANDGTSKVWYAELSEQDNSIRVEHFSFEYDCQLASDLMIESGLPKEYAKTLLTGIWDNCEILPEVETLNQGKEIVI